MAEAARAVLIVITVIMIMIILKCTGLASSREDARVCPSLLVGPPQLLLPLQLRFVLAHRAQQRCAVRILIRCRVSSTTVAILVSLSATHATSRCCCVVAAAASTQCSERRHSAAHEAR